MLLEVKVAGPVTGTPPTAATADPTDGGMNVHIAGGTVTPVPPATGYDPVSLPDQAATGIGVPGAWFPFNGNTTDAEGGASATLHGSATYQSASMPIDPYDQELPPILATITGTTTITDGTIKASDIFACMRTVTGGVVTTTSTIAPAAGSVVFTFGASDTSTYVCSRTPQRSQGLYP